jgi:hypothetical protein
MTQPVEPSPSQRLTEAFHWIAMERERRSKIALGELIADAAARFSLTSVEHAWVKWSLDPKSVALAPKEPEASGSR